MHSYILNNFPKDKLIPKIQDLSQINLKNINIQNHSDIFLIKADEKLKSGAISIDQIRELKNTLIHTPLSLSSYIVIVENSQNLTPQAQNAFLKLLEEPNIDTFIFLLTDNYKNLLTTIQSRCQIINFRGKIDNNKNLDSEKDLGQLNKNTQTQRMVSLEKLHKDKQKALIWIENSINFLRKNPNPKNLNLLKNLTKTHQDIKSNINLKLALDNLSIKWNNL